MIGMASKSTPPAEDPPLPEDAAGLEEALTQLLAQRASLADALAGHPVRERRLLERQAPEAEVGANDVHRRRIAYQLETTERREHELRTALAAARRDARQSVWEDVVDEFEEAAKRLRDKSIGMRQAHRDLCDVARRAARSGFNEREHPSAYIPLLPIRIDYDLLEGFHTLVEGMRRIDARAPMPNPLFLVRLSAYTILRIDGVPVAYQARAVAGFDPCTAWDLVDREKAEWFDAANIPPRPKKPRAKKQVEALS